jgi:hypothetical protein
VAGNLLIKFNEQATLAFEKLERKSDITRSGIEPLNLALRTIGATSIERIFPINPKHEERARKAGLHRWYIVSFDSNEQLEKAAKSLAEVAEVDIVQYNRTFSLQPSKSTIVEDCPTTRLAVDKVNDPQFSKQWHYYNTGSGIHEKQVAGMDVNVKEAWLHCTGDPSIIVAVLDEGVDYTHDDLKANMWVNKGEIADNGIDDDGNGYIDDVHGYNFCTADGKLSWNSNGDSGHGTHVAGTIAAVNNNGKGVCGIAGGDGSGNGVKIMSAQKSRGADFENGNILKRVKALFPIFIPLFISAFKRAFELADAMSCRCYTGGAGRTRLRQMKLTWRDTVCSIITVIVIGGSIVSTVVFERLI